MVGEVFDDDFKKEVDEKVRDVLNHIEEEKGDDFLDMMIDIEETEAAIQLLKTGKAPGPDSIYGDLLKAADQQLIEAVNSLFRRSWDEGILPAQWKEAKVKFLKKAGKASYHNPSSYRPISLTSILGKCMERIIYTRLYSYAEHHNLIDPEQEGFRRFHGTSMALLRVVQNAMDGFNERESTVGVFIDMEKAYDSVWRNGLLEKMHNIGIKGKMWNWLHNFLHGREAYCYLQGSNQTKFETDMGLPQGSVLSPVLFSLFIADIYTDVESEKVKFADDGTIWRTGENVKILVEQLEGDLKKIVEWTKRWRMKVNVDKTEFCVFSRSLGINDTDDIEIIMNNKKIKKSSAPKLLGVTLDSKLTFRLHIDSIERKALKASAALYVVGKSEQVSAKNMIQLYRSLVLPHLEYAASVWQIGNCEQLNKVQRKCLALCLGTPTTAGLDALEVEAGVKPLDLRREDLAVRELTKIIAKDSGQKIVECFKTWKAKAGEAQEKIMSPFGMAYMQLNETISNTGIDIRAVEPEFSYLQSLRPSKQRPEYWNNLGSSKSRSTSQAEEARNVIEKVVKEAGTNVVTGFTDGSCFGNPGPCGAGACLFFPSQERLDLYQPVARRASILLGELVAIKIALDQVKLESGKRAFKEVTIFSDSQSAIGILTLGWQNKSHKAVIAEINQILTTLNKDQIQINLKWTPGHADISGNEIADQLAKKGAEEAERMPEVTNPVTQLDIKTAVQESCNMKWQKRWEVGTTGRHMFELRPSVNVQTAQVPNTKTQRIISELRTGYCRLNEYKHKTGLKETPNCNCGDPESVQHFIEECKTYDDIRERLRTRLFYSCGISDFTMKLFLEVIKEDPLKPYREVINSIFEEFLAETGRFDLKKLH
ncbi:MAG: reverse transcriptase domain-containing protein [Candidatus Thiodiazotropha endolucinida]|nr:hypothetical protein [Candidatus Thiodiazotropha taylori]MCW4263848.1 reverse transcriptase domain-containing protein [Candidatus Thiodiazotropha endolucinida]